MATAASNRPDAQSEAPHPGATGRARIGIAGATGYAGQELVKILARHPGVTLTTAMASAATSTPRAMPALARIWDQPVVPLDVVSVESRFLDDAIQGCACYAFLVPKVPFRALGESFTGKFVSAVT